MKTVGPEFVATVVAGVVAAGLARAAVAGAGVAAPAPGPVPVFRETKALSLPGLRAARGWAGCANRDVTFTAPSGAAQHWHFGKPALAARGSVVTLPQRAADGGSGCERAIGARDNVVIDVMACGYGNDPTGQARDIVALTADYMPRPV
jgi:hypothetical protein